MWGPLGTKKGRTIPTTAQIAENSRTGRNEAPISPGLESENTPRVMRNLDMNYFKRSHRIFYIKCHKLTNASVSITLQIKLVHIDINN